jgi:hypothetical protein
VEPTNSNRSGQPSAYSQSDRLDDAPREGFESIFEMFGQGAPCPRVAPSGVGQARTKQSEHHQSRMQFEQDVSRILTAILDEAEARDTWHDEPLDLRLMLAAERLRQLGGAGARVSVILTMVDRERFDELEFAGQTKTECEHHGVRVKALFSPLWRLLVLHATEPPNF